MNHYESIPVGKENAISRSQLSIIWGVRERRVREIIKELREKDNGDDFVIISTAHSAGYYRSSDRDEIAKFKSETTRRGKNTFRPLRKVNRILGVHDHQSSMTNPLKIARLEANLKGAEVVDVLKKLDSRFDKSLLSKIENGVCAPTPAQLEIISRLYDKPIDELVGIYIATQ